VETFDMNNHCDMQIQTFVNEDARVYVVSTLEVFFFTWAAMEKSNTTFNTISVISWWSVLLLEETRVPGENHRLGTSH
jgi:hypothetical protein